MKSISLYYNDLAVGGTSDKEYHLQLEKKGEGYVVNFQFGRRGSTLQTGTKTPNPVALEEAEHIYSRKFVEQTAKGYHTATTSHIEQVMEARAGIIPSEKTDTLRTSAPVELLEEISREEADVLLKSPKYWLQKKYDGERRQIQKAPKGAVGFNKKGGAVYSLPRGILADLEQLEAKSCLMDGEQIGDAYFAYDLLELNGKDLRPLPYAQRYEALRKLIPDDGYKPAPGGDWFVVVAETWFTAAQKTGALAKLFAARAEGVVFKLASAPYRGGRNGQHKKFKFTKSASCKVTAVGEKGKSNAVLAMLDERGAWVEVAHASTIGKGKIAVGQIVEVCFLYATAGCRLYQPRIKEIRTDVSANECRLTQLKHAFKEGVAA